MFSSLIQVVLAALLLSGAAEAVETTAGVRLVEVEDPVSHRPMKAAVFYPTPDAVEIM